MSTTRAASLVPSSESTINQENVRRVLSAHVMSMRNADVSGSFASQISGHAARPKTVPPTGRMQLRYVFLQLV